MSKLSMKSIQALHEVNKHFGDPYWTLRKVWLDEVTFSIKARFKHESIGMVQGTVTPDFCVTESMTLSEIAKNVTIESIKESNISRIAAGALNMPFEIE